MTKKHSSSSKGRLFLPSKAPSHRQLRVGEEIKHILAEILGRGDFSSLELARYSITITQVQVSPDLHNATVFIMPLGGESKDDVLLLLKEQAPHIRHLLGKKLKVRHIPSLRFLLDQSFDHAQKIDKLIRDVLKEGPRSDNTDL